MVAATVVICGVHTTASAEGNGPAARFGLSGGMGVVYISAHDIVDRINATSGSVQRVDDFKSSVEFFGAVAGPLCPDWVIKVEYSYMLGSYNVSGFLGPSEYTYEVHMPTIIGQYVLVNEPGYNIKAGAGFGYHFGSLKEQYGAAVVLLTGKGVGAKIEFEGNTAFGEHLYAFLGVDMRWSFIGELTNPSFTVLSPPTLHFFGVGAKLGFTYYF
jgi:hypothetical protein